MRFIIKLNLNGGYDPQPIPFTYSSKEDLHHELRVMGTIVGKLLRKREALRQNLKALLKEAENISSKKVDRIEELYIECETIQAECDVFSVEINQSLEFPSECGKHKINIGRILGTFYTYTEPTIYTVDEYFESEEIKE